MCNEQVELFLESMEGVPTMFMLILLDVTVVVLVDIAVNSKWYCGMVFGLIIVVSEISYF